MDIEHHGNPYCFYGLVAFGCSIELNLADTRTEEFHGASIFKNGIDVSIAGANGGGSGYVLFDGLQLGHSDSENMYLDQQNATVLCAANCSFSDWGEHCSSGDYACLSALVIGPDAQTIAGGVTPIVAQFNRGVFGGPGTDVYFATDTVQ